MPEKALVRRLEEAEWPQYREIPMHFKSDQILRVEPLGGGLGGLGLVRKPVAPFQKDFGAYDDPVADAARFGGAWVLFGAFVSGALVGGAALCFHSDKIHMLEGRGDLGVLWDLRVTPDFKRQGIGQALFDAVCQEARGMGLKELKIECQNNNPAACRFYRKQGAVLAKIDTRAYAAQPAVAEEAQLIWYLDLMVRARRPAQDARKPIRVRPYQPGDVERMIELWNAVVEDGVAFPQEVPLALAAGRAFFGEQSACGVATDQKGKIVGLYILHPNNIGRCGHICNASYAVAEAARGCGLGEALVLDSMKRAKALGFRILQFNAVVASNRPARHLYERLGFQQLGVIPGGFRLQDGTYADICPYFIEL